MQNSKGFSALLDAKPFVPRSGGPASTRPADGYSHIAAQGDPGLQPYARPFVPGPTAGSPRQQLQSMSSAAQPFVPQAAARPQGTDALASKHSFARPPGHPHLPDSDDLLGMTAHAPEDVQHAAVLAQASPASRAPWLPSSSLRGQAPAFEVGTSDMRAAPSERGALPGGFPTAAPHAQAAVLPHARTPDRGRGRGRKQQSYLGGGPASGNPPFQQPQPAPMPSPVAMATSKAAMLAGANAERLRQGMAQRSHRLQAQADLQAEGLHGLSSLMHQYHSLYPLEDLGSRAEQPSQVLGVPSVMIKGISLHDGQAHAIRRIDGRQVPATPDVLAAAQEAVATWAPLSTHPHIAPLRAAFVSTDAVTGQASLCVAHAFFPGAVNLEQAHLQPRATATGLMRSNTASEDTLWSYLVQLTLAMRAVHSNGLACRARSLHQSKVLLTSPGRIRLGSVGLMAVLAMEPMGVRQRPADPAQQAEDIAGIGRLMLVLGTAGGHLSMDTLAARFSPEFVRIVHGALPPQEGGAGAISSWQQLSGLLGDRLLAELDASELAVDAVERTLGQEAENGRLLRLLVRLSLVHERPGPDGSPNWSDEGDRYPLKLFHSWLFSSQAANGRPLLDWGRVVEGLNKLDAGVPERIALLSRDEATLLAVSYADLRRCLTNSYTELRAASAAPALPVPSTR